MSPRIDDDRLDSGAVVPLVDALLAELLARYGFPDPTDGTTADDFTPPAGAFVVAWSGPTAIGCGGVRRHDHGTGELKRMYVTPTERGRGVGRAVLVALEGRACGLGYERLVLETGLHQPEAISLYTSAGYEPIAAYGIYRSTPLSRCFAKQL